MRSLFIAAITAASRASRFSVGTWSERASEMWRGRGADRSLWRRDFRGIFTLIEKVWIKKVRYDCSIWVGRPVRMRC